MKPTVKAGSKIVVDTNACSWDSEVSPVVTVDARCEGRTYRRGKTGPDGTYCMKPTLTQKVVATDETGHQWRIKFSQVDWVKTAEANGIPLANPDAVNHIGPVVTEEEMRRIERWKARPLNKWMISSILIPARSGPRSSSPQAPFDSSSLIGNTTFTGRARTTGARRAMPAFIAASIEALMDVQLMKQWLRWPPPESWN